MGINLLDLLGLDREDFVVLCLWISAALGAWLTFEAALKLIHSFQRPQANVRKC